MAQGNNDCVVFVFKWLTKFLIQTKSTVNDDKKARQRERERSFVAL